MLTHAVRVDEPADDFRPDFLADDDLDEDHLPEIVYNSDGTTAPVKAVLEAAVNGSLSAQTREVQLNANATDGFIYINTDDPGGDAFRLLRVVRSDGKELLPDDNAWTTHRTRRLVGQDPYREHKLHIFDSNSTGSYTLTYEAAIDCSLTSPAPAFGATQIAPGHVTLAWTPRCEASSYEVYVWKDTESRPLTPTATVYSAGYAFPLALDAGTRYWWQVLARDTSIGDVAGPDWTFITKAAAVTTSTALSTTTTAAAAFTTTISAALMTTTSAPAITTTSVPPTTTISTTTIPEAFMVSPQQFNVALPRGEARNKTLTLNNQTSASLDFAITYPALVTLLTDPEGDVNPGTSTKPIVDVVGVDAGFNWNMQWMRLKISFSGPVIPELIGYIYLDTDQNPATGKAGMAKYYGAGILGYEYMLNYFSAGTEGLVVVEDASGAKGPLMLSGFYSNSDTVFTVDVPLASIGNDDGNINLGILLGNTAFKLDIVPDTTKAVLNGQGTFIPWLSISQATGSVNAHESLPLVLGFDAARIKEGVYTDHLTLQTSGSLVTGITVPITLTVYKDGQRVIEGHMSGTVQGSVTINLSEVSGCTETLVASTMPDADGDFGFYELKDGSYTVRAQQQGHAFAPEFYLVTIPRENQDYMDFITP
jgi:hypothetical protein